MSATKSKTPEYYFTRISLDTAQCLLCNEILSIPHFNYYSISMHLEDKHKIQINSIRNLKMIDTFDEPRYFNKETELVDVIARFACTGGSIGTLINSSLRAIFLHLAIKIPESQTTMQKMIVDYSNTKKEELKNILVTLKAEDVKFCITLDEWTDKYNRRFINIILSYRNNENDTYVQRYLGLIHVKKNPGPGVLRQLVTIKLNEFNLDIDLDIVALSHNGADKMRDYDCIVGTKPQVCFIQAMHSSIMKILYKRFTNFQITINELANERIKYVHKATDEHDSEYYEVNNSDLSSTISDRIHHTLKVIRNVFMFFINSTENKAILQNHLNSRDGDELNLSLDCKHEWITLLPMLNEFVEIYQHLKQALIEIGQENLLEDIDVADVQRLAGTLTPLVLAIAELDKPSVNLLKSEGILHFVLEQLRYIDTELGHAIYDDLYDEISRRRNSELMTLLLYLHKGSLPKSCIGSVKSYVDRSAAIKYGDDLIQRLFPDVYEKFTPHQRAKRLKLEPPEEGNSLYDEMKAQIEIIMADSEQSMAGIESWQSFLEKQFDILDVTRRRTPILERLYKCLLTIRPTVMTSEQAFMVAGGFITMMRISPKPDTLDALVFLKDHFLKNGEKTPETNFSIPDNLKQ